MLRNPLPRAHPRIVRTARRTRGAAAVAACVAVALLLSGASCDPATPPASRKLDWGLLDRTDNVTRELADGASAVIDWRHGYLLTFRSNDPDGVKHVAQWAEGTFSCSSDPDPNGTVWTAPRRLDVSLPREELEINPGLYYGFVLRGEFVPERLSCGTFTFSGPGRPLEYFVTKGTLHVHGESTNHAGGIVSASLDLVI